MYNCTYLVINGKPWFWKYKLDISSAPIHWCFQTTVISEFKKKFENTGLKSIKKPCLNVPFNFF